MTIEELRERAAQPTVPGGEPMIELPASEVYRTPDGRVFVRLIAICDAISK